VNGNDKNVGKQLAGALEELFAESKQELATGVNELGDYVAERISHLKFAMNEPGYPEAVAAERDAIALKAAGRTVDKADEFDAHLVGLVEKGLVYGLAGLKF
jgi:hypothetical protein